jgi:hypothetical protein
MGNPCLDDETKARKNSRAAVSPGGVGSKPMWETGLYGCCDEGCGTCLYAFCCVPCAMSSARSRMKKHETV